MKMERPLIPICFWGIIMTKREEGEPVMEKGQNQFFTWILERAREGKEAELSALLKENFAQQQAGVFDADALAESGKRILELIKPEYVDEFKKAMEHFGKSM